MLRSARRVTAPLLTLCLIVSAAATANAATFRTANFVVTSASTDRPLSQQEARKIAEAAEVYRRELALEWTGQVMPNWGKPCPIRVKVGNVGAGGSTTFTFDRDRRNEVQVFGWRMNVQGTMERILDSVLPHEVSHTVFACYFRRPLPRWADEGAATLVEHKSERMRQTKLLNQVIRTSRRIPLRKLLSMTEYPDRMQDVLTLYAEGHALADLLVQKKGKATYLKVLQAAHERGWEAALRTHYGYESIGELEQEWTGWILAGSPTLPSDTLVAAATPAGARGQNPSRAEVPAASGEAAARSRVAAAVSKQRTPHASGRDLPKTDVLSRPDRSRLSRPVLVRTASDIAPDEVIR